MHAVTIREAADADADGIWRALEPMIRAGETYTTPRDMTREATIAYWLGPDRTTYVAVADGQILGTYYIKPNQAGGGDHVCNCGYVTAEAARGRGIARQMGLHSLDEARRAKYRAMQFNFVVSSNAPAVRLWQSLGFAIVGTLPKVFRHPVLGEVDAYVMHRFLDA